MPLHDVLNTSALTKDKDYIKLLEFFNSIIALSVDVPYKSIKQLYKWSPWNSIKDNLSGQNFYIWPITQNWSFSFHSSQKFTILVNINICKVKTELSQSIMIDVISLDQSDSYNLRLESLTRRNNFSFQTVSTIGSILWKKTIKQPTNAASLNIFKEKM